MATKQQDQPQTDRDKPGRQPFPSGIGHQVMHALGQPGNLHKVQVWPLWEDHYRVNVVVGADATSARVAHSFFLVTDREGTILESTPEIARHY